MPNTSDRWAIDIPDASYPLVPLQNLSAGVGQSVASRLTALSVPVSVTGQAQRDSFYPSPVDGDRVWREDLDLEEFYNGTAWLQNRPGLNTVTPTTLGGSGGSLAGNRVAIGATGDTIIVNGVFTTRFRKYLVVADWRVLGGVNGAYFRLCSGGVQSTANVYTTQALVVSGATVLAQLNSSINYFPGVSTAANEHTAQFEIYNPYRAARTSLTGKSNSYASGTGLAEIGGSHDDAVTLFDGFSLELSTKGAGRTWNGGEITVYGMA